jgi:hypothetical protein
MKETSMFKITPEQMEAATWIASDPVVGFGKKTPFTVSKSGEVGEGAEVLLTGRVCLSTQLDSNNLVLHVGWIARAEVGKGYLQQFSFDVELSTSRTTPQANFAIVFEDDSALFADDFANTKLFEYFLRGKTQAVQAAIRSVLPRPLDRIIIDRDHEKSLAFYGELIARADSRKPYDSMERWYELYLYKTVGGNYVAVRSGLSTVGGEVSKTTAKSCATEEEVIDFLGLGSLAKQIYNLANIEYNEPVA